MRTVQISLQLSPLHSQLNSQLKMKSTDIESLTKREKLINEFQMNGNTKPFGA